MARRNVGVESFWETVDGKVFPNKGLAKAHETNLARQMVKEEVQTKRYPISQAVAIGLSRARRAGIKVPKKG